MTTTKKISELPSAVTPLQGDELMPIVQDNATRKVTTGDLVAGKADTVHTHTLSDIADAGTAAGSNIGDFADAAQGALADTALQPADVGSAAYNDTGDFATAAQGGLADTAVSLVIWLQLLPAEITAISTIYRWPDLPTPSLMAVGVFLTVAISH